MKKLIIFGIAVASVCASDIAYAAAPTAVNPDGKKIVKKIDRAKLQAAIYKRTGGKLKVPGTQQGTLTYVNAQKKAPVEWLQQNAEVFAKNAKVDLAELLGERFVLASETEEGQREFAAWQAERRQSQLNKKLNNKVSR